MSIKPLDCNQRGEEALGGLYIRPVSLPNVGDEIPGHTHNFDHVTFIGSGTVAVHVTKPDGTHDAQIITGPAYFNVEKSWVHRITAMTPKVWFWCVFAEFDATGARVSAGL